MEYDKDMYRHGSPESGDFRQMMSQAIEEGLGYKYFPRVRSDRTLNPAARKRPFFQDTVKHLNGSGTLDRILKTAFREKGLILE